MTIARRKYRGYVEGIVDLLGKTFGYLKPFKEAPRDKYGRRCVWCKDFSAPNAPDRILLASYIRGKNRALKKYRTKNLICDVVGKTFGYLKPYKIGPPQGKTFQTRVWCKDSSFPNAPDRLVLVSSLRFGKSRGLKRPWGSGVPILKDKHIKI